MGNKPKDLSGQKFGRLTALHPIKGKHASDGSRVWLCSCDCNPAVRTEASAHLLLNGHVRSCGCILASQALDLTGRRFGRLLVKYKSDHRRHPKKIYWVCECDCGKEAVVEVSKLTSGETRSCGCLATEARVLANTKYTSPIQKKLRIKFGYMKTRCYNKNNSNYAKYGAKGIYICEEWLNDPMKFIDWSISHGYHEGLQIDRYPDRNGPYAPWNCRYVGPIEQAENKDVTSAITALGTTKSAHAWDEFFDTTRVSAAYRRKGYTAAVDTIHELNGSISEVSHIPELVVPGSIQF